MSNHPSRREALTFFATGAMAAARLNADTATLRFAALDHVAIAVSDVQKSVAFYARIFGNTVLKDNRSTRRYLKLGPCYIAIAPPAQGQEAHRVDHICAGIQNFQMSSVMNFLKTRGIPSQDATVSVFVTDPDGIQVQFFTTGSWNGLRETASREPVPSSPAIFDPAGLDHVLLRVRALEQSEPFYAKIFGPVVRRANSRIFFQVGKSRIGLRAAVSGERLGVDHFCVNAPRFDYAATVKKLESAGAKIKPPEVEGAPEFYDPDNILVQVWTPRPERWK